MRKKNYKLFIVDGGNMLIKSPTISETTKKAVFAKANAIIESQKAMGIDAGNIGYKDAVFGIKFLEKTEKGGYPWVSANLRTVKGKVTKIPSYRIKEVAGIKIGVFGILDNKGLPSGDQASTLGFTVADPLEAAKNTVKELNEKGVDLVVMLSGMAFLRNKELLKQVKGINFVINGGDPRMLHIPERQNEALLFAALNRGKYVGVAHVGFSPGNTSFRMVGEKVDIESKLAIIQVQRKILEGEIATLPQVRTKLAEMDSEEEDLLARKESLTKPASTVKNLLAPLDLNIPDRPDVVELLKQAKAGKSDKTPQKPTNREK